MTHRIFLALLLLGATELSAQVTPGDARYRSPDTALLLEYLMPGWGHFYAGETKRGAFLLVGSVGAAGAGLVGTLASQDRCDSRNFGAFNRCVDENHINWAPLAVGLGVAVGIRLYGLFDADDAARRANARGLASVAPVRPVVAARPGGETRLGLELTLPR